MLQRQLAQLSSRSSRTGRGLARADPDCSCPVCCRCAPEVQPLACTNKSLMVLPCFLVDDPDTAAPDSLAAGCAAVHGSSDGEGAVTLAIALCGSKLNKRNYWTGAWRSAWQVTVRCLPPAGGSGGHAARRMWTLHAACTC